jgi:membrane protease subunit HflC
MKRSPLTIAVAAVLIIIFGLLLFVYQVRKSQVAVVTLFGKIDRVKDTPGPGLRWPWPIEKVIPLDQRIQNFEDKYEQIKLLDQSIIMLQVYVGWRIDNPQQFFPKVLNGSIPEAEQILESIVRNAKNEVAGLHSFSDFVSTDQKQMKFGEIERQILDRVQQQMSTNQYGMEVKFVQIKEIGLPESVTQNVFDRMKAERQYYIDKITASGEEDALKIRSAADSTAAKLLSDADAQAFRIRGEGESQMIQSLQVLQQNPALATFNMQITALEQLLKEKSTLILDQSTAPLNLLQTIGPEKSSTNAATSKIP